MRLGRKMNDSAHVIFFKKSGQQRRVANIPVYKTVTRILLTFFQTGQIGGVGQLVQVQHAPAGISRQKIRDKIGADKPRSAGD